MAIVRPEQLGGVVNIRTSGSSSISGSLTAVNNSWSISSSGVFIGQQFSGSFSGSFQGDGSGLTGVGVGSQGVQGLAGTNGTDGTNGAQGAIGFGLQGAIGAQGFKGNTGNTGLQGTEGAQGGFGKTGAGGTQGSSGVNGAQGAKGNAGNTGTQGTIGSQGIQGVQGVDGLFAGQGAVGSQGQIGITGAQGTMGYGSQGAIGTQGAQGYTGAQGTQGQVGSQGVQGLSGTQGAVGAQGTQGTQGQIGSQGVQGLSGAQGQFGAQGAQGVQGLQGLQGLQGAQGIFGAQGVQGTLGLQGVQGTLGAQGIAGVIPNTGSFATTGSNIFTGDITVLGSITATQYIVSSSIYHVTQSFSSGSTIFGDTLNDTHQFTGSVYITGSLFVNGSDVLLSNQTSTITVATASYISPTFISSSVSSFGFGAGAGFPYSGSAVITGSLTVTQGITVSQSISAYNINAGTPSSNAWGSNLGGSYFNNFTSNSSVSDILRFVAGLLSGSAPDAAPNTKTYGSLTRAASNSTNSTTPIAGYIPQSYSDSNVIYIVSKGFASTGTVLYNGLTVYSNSGYSNAYSSAFGGTTTISSSVDTQLFGNGTIVDANTPNTLYVSGTLNWSYEDSSAATATATSQSQAVLSNNTFSTTNGLTIGKIPTANAAVIPAAYQDAKFASIFSSGLYNGGRSLTSVSSSGYYHISSSIKIASGSSAYSTSQTSYDKIFFAPVSNITLNTQTLTVPTVTTASLTATSSSLSGAPYLRTATWSQVGQINGAFNPLYVANTNIGAMAGPGGLVTLTATSPGNYIAAINSSAQVNTANTIYDSTGVTARSTATIPYETDIIKLSGSLSFDAGSAGSTNILVSSISPTTFTVTTTGINRSNATGVTDTQTYSYHVAGAYGQPSSSGSLAYYGFQTPILNTATSETFKDEANRITLNDSMLTFAGTAFVSSSRLGTKDLQVKPGWLVEPGGSRRYWYPSGYGDTHKFYVRKFKRTTSIASFTLSVGQTLVPWDDTTTANGVSVGIIFESAVNGQNSLTTTRIFDPYYTTGLVTSGITANTAGSNPFGSAIDLYGIRTGAPSGTTYTVEISNANKVYMNGTTYDEFYVIIRYRGEPTTAVTTLSVS